MPINLWIIAPDEGRLDKIIELELALYSKDILTAQLENEGALAKIGKDFVLGRERIWIPQETDIQFKFVRINNSSAYRDGLILTPYDGIDVDYHLRGKRIDKRTNLERVELQGIADEDFVKRVFRTYHGPEVRRLYERDNHLVLYRSDGRRH